MAKKVMQSGHTSSALVHATDSRQPTATDQEATMARISALHDELRAAEYELAGVVGAAREGGVTWDAIGEAYGGITRQGASQRFRSVVGPTGTWSRLPDEERRRLRRRAGVAMRPPRFAVEAAAPGQPYAQISEHATIRPAIRRAQSVFRQAAHELEVRVVKIEASGRRRDLGLPPMPAEIVLEVSEDGGPDFADGSTF